jgi:TDG/mug DNA glycosylase family protein
MPTTRPTKADLAAATSRSIPDVIAPGLDILFVGINPGLWSGATGFHFARPGNRFWKAIHLAGLTDRVLDPSEQHELLRFGMGVTNLVPRTTATAAELTASEPSGRGPGLGPPEPVGPQRILDAAQARRGVRHAPRLGLGVDPLGPTHADAG